MKLNLMKFPFLPTALKAGVILSVFILTGCEDDNFTPEHKIYTVDAGTGVTLGSVPSGSGELRFLTKNGQESMVKLVDVAVQVTANATLQDKTGKEEPFKISYSGSHKTDKNSDIYFRFNVELPRPGLILTKVTSITVQLAATKEGKRYSTTMTYGAGDYVWDYALGLFGANPELTITKGGIIVPSTRIVYNDTIYLKQE